MIRRRFNPFVVLLAALFAGSLLARETDDTPTVV